MSNLYDVISHLATAIERVVDKVQALDPNADMSALRGDLQQALSAAEDLSVVDEDDLRALSNKIDDLRAEVEHQRVQAARKALDELP